MTALAAHRADRERRLRDLPRDLLRRIRSWWAGRDRTALASGLFRGETAGTLTESMEPSRMPLYAARAQVHALADLLERLKDGRAHWSAWNDEYACGDRTACAIDECSQELDYWRGKVARLEANGGTA